MIIDFHTHTFPVKIASAAIESLSSKSHTVPFTDGTNEGLLSSMEQSGVDISVILPVATAARQVERINDRAAALNAAEMNDGHPRLLSFGCMHPDLENYKEELLRIRELGLKGIKIHPVYQETDIDDIRFLRIFDVCAQLGLAVITHAGLDIGYPGVVHCSPAMCRTAAREVDGLTLILAHMGGWEEWQQVPDQLADTNVLLDTAFSTGAIVPLQDGYWKNGLDMMGQDAFMEICRAFGTERILFGTDSPWSRQDQTVAFMRSLPVTASELEQILYKNAARILRID